MRRRGGAVESSVAVTRIATREPAVEVPQEQGLSHPGLSVLTNLRSKRRRNEAFRTPVRGRSLATIGLNRYGRRQPGNPPPHRCALALDFGLLTSAVACP
jgi:hypothetical protein